MWGDPHISAAELNAPFNVDWLIDGVKLSKPTRRGTLGGLCFCVTQLNGREVTVALVSGNQVTTSGRIWRRLAQACAVTPSSGVPTF